MEAVEDIAELNSLCQAKIQYLRHRLPQDLRQTNSLEVFIPLWDQDNNIPGTLLREVTLT